MHRYLRFLLALVIAISLAGAGMPVPQESAQRPDDAPVEHCADSTGLDAVVSIDAATLQRHTYFPVFSVDIPHWNPSDSTMTVLERSAISTPVACESLFALHCSLLT